MNLPKGLVVTLIRFVAAIAVALLPVITAHTEPVAHGSIAPEDRYIAARNAAIEKFSAIYDAGKFDDAATAAEEAARADLTAQISAILNEPRRTGFGPATINLESFYKGDEGFGALDGLRFNDELGANGEKAGGNGADGKYVEPRAHIIVTTQTLFERWLRAHREWWGSKIKNVPQRIGDPLRDESFYTQAISSGAAVINFNALPIAKPGSAIFAHAMLAGRTQSEVPDAADEIFVSAIADGKVYVAYGSIKPEVRIAACTEIRAGYDKRSTEVFEQFQRKEIDQKAYDRSGNLRQKGEDAFKRCFTERAPREPAFADATRQAQELLAKAMGR